MVNINWIVGICGTMQWDQTSATAVIGCGTHNDLKHKNTHKEWKISSLMHPVLSVIEFHSVS
jgi:hypothetical protein